ncbi:MAG: cytochrome c oxidase accessory protein CcoG [Alphaproteobacteria bacterium]|nr:cytochrome c oxidase accessory protein CcoG [Alphaproteobacteria bacterium]
MRAHPNAVSPQAVSDEGNFAAEGVHRSDATAVNKANTRTLYKNREPVYPKLVHGTFRRAKWAFMILALAVYYILPWIRWPRGGNAPDQAVLADFANARFYFFWLEIWPQEVYYITGLLILSALGLFFVTALFGRVWCGYACPQTVWTDLYILVERAIEGDRNARIRLAKEPWSVSKLTKKLSKHIVWILIAAATGGAFIFYWHDAPSTFFGLFDGTAPLSAYLFLGILTFTTYLLAGHAREQVCIYMCPWPRIQAAMTDAHSLAVTYRYDRGEPRGPHKKGQDWSNRGDCIDCNQCVAACPMGIDIRDGAQLECINCALCIDACNEVMDKVNRPRGLIAYDTDLNITNRLAKKPSTYPFVRPRTVLYASVISIVGAVMLFSLLNRVDVQLNVIHDRQPPFVMLSDGSVRNGYTLKIVNRAGMVRNFAIEFDSPVPLSLKLVGAEKDADGLLQAEVEPDGVRELRIYAVAAKGDVKTNSFPVKIRVRDTQTGVIADSAQVFLARK